MHVGMMGTPALGVLALFLGDVLNKRVRFLRDFCIPAPVTGGFIFSLATLALHACIGFDIDFDVTIKDVCMLLFFTTVGLQCDFKLLKKGGRSLLVLIALVALLVVFQNLLSVGLSVTMGQDPMLGMASGSITMLGGHGTAGGFASLLEERGLLGAAPISMAAATFGLIAGSLMGGPLGKSLVDKFSLKPSDDFEITVEEEIDEIRRFTDTRLVSVCFIFLLAGAGSLLSGLLDDLGLTVPTYFGALILAILARNVSESSRRLPKLPMLEISYIGKISLALFLGMALVSLRLWELSDIALPLLVILMCQVLMMFLFARFIAFPMMGKNYDAAILTGGLCGFGLGATPNALANMNAICEKYGYSMLPFIIVPIVGAAFVDIINITFITFFLNCI